MLNKTIDFDGVKNQKPPLVGQPQGYGLALIKYAEQSILYSYVPIKKKNKTKQKKISNISQVRHNTQVLLLV